MNIEFQNFPTDFNPIDNFFLSHVIESGILDNCTRDISFYGCYPEKRIAGKAFLYAKSRMSSNGMSSWLNFQNGIPEEFDEKKLNFWTTFENRRPPSSKGVYSFSFDLDSYENTNFYLPLIYLYLDLELSIPFTPRHPVTQETAFSPRRIPDRIKAKKNRDACTFVSNPHPMRLRAIEGFRRIRDIDIYGRYSGNYVKNKIATGEHYWLNFCFENDLFPGYVTEKALEAWMSYSIPVYWGDDQNNVLNSKAIVNLKDFSSIKEFLDFIEYLLQNQTIMEEMIMQPILNTKLENFRVQEFITTAAMNL